MVQKDLAEGFQRFGLAWALAQDDLKARYQRTIFGILWVAISFGLFCVAKIAVFGQISTLPFEYFSAYLILGFLIWSYISGSLTDGCTAFIVAKGWILGIRLPLTTHILRVLVRLATTTFYSAVPALIIVFWLGYPASATGFAAILALPLYAVTSFAAQIILAIVCTRYRDIQHLVGTIVRILFFVTPIIWVPSQLGKLATVAFYNQFTHYIEICRAPLVDDRFPLESWAIVLPISASLCVIAYVLFRTNFKRVALWL